MSSKRGWRSEGIEITEELILNRAGHFELSQDSVAARAFRNIFDKRNLPGKIDKKNSK